MASSDRYGSIEHEGVVCSADSNSVIVSILSESACAGCHAKGYCNYSGTKNKMIEVHGNYDVLPGDKVMIIMERSAGYKALFLGYILPLIVVIIVLAVFSSLPLPELFTGLASLGVLGIYYLFLYLLRDRIGNKFTFKIKTR